MLGRIPESKPYTKGKKSLLSSKAALLCAGIVFFASLFLYRWTLAPTVTLVDSGELIVAARSLGVAHPPGFPLYVMLAHLASLVPLGSVAVRVNFASALFAALACAMLTLVVAELMMIAAHLAVSKQRVKKRGGRKNKKASGRTIGVKTDDDSINSVLLVLAPALASGLLMAFSRTLWSYATIAEVYTLNTLLILIIFFLMLRWRRRMVEHERGTTANTGFSSHASVIADYDSPLYAAAVIFGLALGVHHVTIALMLPALAVLVYGTEGLRFFTSKRLLYAALFSLAALIAVYSYLPLAASRAPIINWGNPRSLQEIWWHITGRQYQAFFSFAPKIMGAQLVEFGKLALREFGPAWLPLALPIAIGGFGYAFKRDRTIFWFLTLIIIADMAYALSYTIAEDKDAYYLPTFISAAIAAGFGMRWLLQFVLSRRPATRKASILTAVPMLLVPVIALAGNWPFNNRSHYFIGHDYVENILSTIEPNSLLLTLDWQVESPMLYAREVEQRRRDVKVVDVNLLRRSWYFDYLRRAYPGLIERSRDKVDAFVAELKQWEHDPQAYANDVKLTQRITSEFHQMLQSFVANEIEVASVYITFDFAFMTEEQDKELTKWLTKNYQLVPEGLVFKLAGDRGFHDPGEIHLETRGLADGSLRFEKDDVVSLKVLPVYTTMLVNRGRYLAFFNQHERAIDAFKQALALDQNLERAQKGIDENMTKLRILKTFPP
jgi:hypothetical protein